MNYIRFVGSDIVHEVNLKQISPNLVQINAPIPSAYISAGFEVLTRPKNGKVFGDYKKYKTIYKKEEDGSVILSNDGSVWKEPVYTVTFEGLNCTMVGKTTQNVKTYDELEIPVAIPNENYEFVEWNPVIPLHGKITKNEKYNAKVNYVKTLEETKEEKVTEMNNTQQSVIQQGLDITLSDGTVEHFTLKDQDQTSLMGLQTLVAQGIERIPWHTADQSEHCKYYSNADMAIIAEKALQFITYHVTYFRDLRIYIRSLQTKEEIQNVTYGMEIPLEYQSEVLKDFLVQV